MKRTWLIAFVVAAFVALFVAGAAAGTDLVSENFDKIANGQLPAGWTPYDGKWEVKDGKLVGHSPNSTTLTRIAFGDPSWHNVEVSAKMKFTWAKDNKRWASLMHHVQPNGGPPYSQLAIRQGTTATNGVEIAYRNPSPAWNVWTTVAYKENFELGVEHTAKVVTYNGKVWGFIDGVLVIELADAVKEASGQVGLHVCGLTVEFDDVVVRSIDEKDIAAMGLK